MIMIKIIITVIKITKDNDDKTYDNNDDDVNIHKTDKQDHAKGQDKLQGKKDQWSEAVYVVQRGLGKHPT